MKMLLRIDSGRCWQLAHSEAGQEAVGATAPPHGREVFRSSWRVGGLVRNRRDSFRNFQLVEQEGTQGVGAKGTFIDDQLNAMLMRQRLGSRILKHLVSQTAQ